MDRISLSNKHNIYKLNYQEKDINTVQELSSNMTYLLKRIGDVGSCSEYISDSYGSIVLRHVIGGSPDLTTSRTHSLSWRWKQLLICIYETRPPGEAWIVTKLGWTLGNEDTQFHQKVIFRQITR